MGCDQHRLISPEAGDNTLCPPLDFLKRIKTLAMQAKKKNIKFLKEEFHCQAICDAFM